MKLAAFEAIATALRDAGVRYLVAGGVAVNAHGYLRLTYDVDLVIQLAIADAAWETATWEGSRRAQLRSALALTVRERMQVLEALTELARRLAEMPRNQAASQARYPLPKSLS